MSSRLLFFCILSLVVSYGFALSCIAINNGNDQGSVKCGSGGCCSKVIDGDLITGKVLDKRCYNDCKKEGCEPYDVKKVDSQINDVGATKTSTVCVCKGNDCNGANSAPFAAAVLLAVLTM